MTENTGAPAEPYAYIQTPTTPDDLKSKAVADEPTPEVEKFKAYYHQEFYSYGDHGVVAFRQAADWIESNKNKISIFMIFSDVGQVDIFFTRREQI